MEFSDAAGGYQCYGIYDGHWGTKAAKFTSRTLHAHIQSLWLDWADESLEEAVREVMISSDKRAREGGRASSFTHHLLVCMPLTTHPQKNNNNNNDRPSSGRTRT